MGSNVQTTSHEGLRAWFEVLRTSREGLMPKYWVDRKRGSTHCTYSGCAALTVESTTTMDWGFRQSAGSNYLYSYRHRGSCPWKECVGIDSRNNFTSQPLERAYVYWARFEHKLNHK